MKALAGWHFAKGGGRAYCDGCKAAGLPCANGRRGADGKRCPYKEHAPADDEARALWALVDLLQGQVRVAGLGAVTGLDAPACAKIAAAHGIAPNIVYQLLPFIEAGLVEALAIKDQGDG